jgi:hypothetical protein
MATREDLEKYIKDNILYDGMQMYTELKVPLTVPIPVEKLTIGKLKILIDNGLKKEDLSHIDWSLFPCNSRELFNMINDLCGGLEITPNMLDYLLMKNPEEFKDLVKEMRCGEGTCPTSLSFIFGLLMSSVTVDEITLIMEQLNVQPQMVQDNLIKIFRNKKNCLEMFNKFRSEITAEFVEMNHVEICRICNDANVIQELLKICNFNWDISFGMMQTLLRVNNIAAYNILAQSIPNIETHYPKLLNWALLCSDDSIVEEMLKHKNVAFDKESLQQACRNAKISKKIGKMILEKHHPTFDNLVTACCFKNSTMFQLIFKQSVLHAHQLCELYKYNFSFVNEQLPLAYTSNIATLESVLADESIDTSIAVDIICRLNFNFKTLNTAILLSCTKRANERVFYAVMAKVPNKIVPFYVYDLACELACRHGHQHHVLNMIDRYTGNCSRLFVIACLSDNVDLVKFLATKKMPDLKMYREWAIHNALLSDNEAMLEFVQHHVMNL